MNVLDYHFVVNQILNGINCTRYKHHLISTNESREFSDELVVESSPSIRVYRSRSAESVEMLEQNGSGLIGADTRCREDLSVRTMYFALHFIPVFLVAAR